MAISNFSVRMFVLHGCNLLEFVHMFLNTQKYRIYFPSDVETVFINLSACDEDLEPMHIISQHPKIDF